MSNIKSIFNPGWLFRISKSFVSGKKYNIGLVLSGGGTRGFAHLGILQALNEAGIYPDIISGSSAGALAGAFYCDGYSPQEVLKIMNNQSRYIYLRPAVPRDGLLQITGIEKILRDNLQARTFEELKVPLIVAATDINNGKAVYFSKGLLIDPLIASSSIPVLFKPVMIGENSYVDGGVLDILPVKPVENICKLLIGSYVNPVGYEPKLSGLIQIAQRSFILSMSKEVSHKIHKFDLYLEPHELKNFSVLDLQEADAVFDIGYKAMREKLRAKEYQKLFNLV
jgi:NTE family protein